MKKKKPFEEFEKYLKLNPDPCGVQKTGLKEYTMEEVAKHNAPPSIWSVYKGFVYDITMYMDYHPGGSIINKVAGKDMTMLYNKFHAYVNIDKFIGAFKIGYIKKPGISPPTLNPNNIPIPYKPQIGNPKNKKNEIMEQQKNENDIKEEDEEDI